MKTTDKLKNITKKIVIANIILVATVTITFNWLAYNAEEAKGIGFFYFGFIALLIDVTLLVMFALGSYIMSKKEIGKSLLFSLLYSAMTFASIHFVFFIFK
ncbi:hypothetical protein AHMF7605_01570 [Adhaeribacter arboris]|uniref:Uncharacterized protein n=1 Tax=Adhaeribacter arboris TaxID=2072846 RepID=A0A2T2Y9V0_9BACT|nr:hypothetical protein [Adhaeribacter arboris]PSR52301.1 hypothetical protein AHMF7605_01570 [Adhaeribacter arboris]